MSTATWRLVPVVVDDRRTLAKLLEAVHPLEVRGPASIAISDLATDSRLASPGSLFFAVPGAKHDGAAFAADAVAAGAVAVVVEGDAAAPAGATVVRVADVRRAKSRIAAEFFGHPTRRLPVAGVTGTNGKTTTTTMIQTIAEYDRGPTVLIGTIDYRVAGSVVASTNTTPDAIDLQRMMRRGLDCGASLAAMEVSSHALDQGRVDDIDFKVGVFTNLTAEHLDYHGTLNQYRDAKARLFEQLCPSAVAVLNADDPSADALRERTRARVVTFGLERRADVTAQVRRVDIDGIAFRLQCRRGSVDVSSRMVGRHNVMNALAAATACLELGYPLEAIRGGFEMLKGVAGRLEPVDCGQDFRVLVDYAHTDDALQKVLLALRPLTRGRIITVFGCGGDRDRTKRPRMGKVAAELSDLTVITSDNPRSESPDAIIAEIRAGFESTDAEHAIEPDRRAAIDMAIRAAAGGDIVLIAGKGCETQQILQSGTIHFDDREVAREALWNL